MTWHWLTKATVLAIHDEQIAVHGGSSGIRDEGLLDSALNRPLNLAAYKKPELEELAASYATGLAQNHPFVDGNKRTAFVVAATFLLLNGKELTASQEHVVETVLKIASGKIREDELASWFKQNSQSIV